MRTPTLVMLSAATLSCGGVATEQVAAARIASQVSIIRSSSVVDLSPPQAFAPQQPWRCGNEMRWAMFEASLRVFRAQWCVPRVLAARTELRGPRIAPMVDSEIRRAVRRMERCYRQVLETSPMASDSFTASVSIVAKGDVSVNVSAGDLALARCVAEGLESTEFSIRRRSEDPTEVALEVRFVPPPPPCP